MLNRKLIASLLVTAMTFSLFVPNIAMALDSVETDETMPPDESAYTEVVETEPIVEETIATESSEEVIETTTETTSETSEPTETSDETEVTETTETSETSETTEETEANLVAFDQTVIVDDTRIQVIADEGVFPEGAYLEATKIENVNIDRSSNVNLVDTMSFDICIYNEDGIEIEPDTEAGSVSVLFFDERISDANLDTTVYHIEDNNPTALEYSYIDGNGDITDSENVAVAVEAETEGFSVYTVEFTYNDMSYVLDGSESVSLSTVLEAVGLVGTAENVTISNTSLVNFDGTNLTAVKPFNSTENMIVTINGIDYEISITDANDIATCGEDAYAIIYDNGTMVIQKGATTDDSIGTATHILAIGTTGTPWVDPDNNIDYSTEITNVIFSNELVGRTSLSGFFATCGNITSITGLNLIDTSEVTSISAMFYNCASLETIDVSGFDTSNVTDMSATFSGCSSLSSLNVSSFNTSNVNNMSAMFYECSSLTTLDLSTFNMSKVTMTGSMFSGCTSLDTLILDNWDLGNTYTISSMLSGLNVTNLSAKNWKNFPASFTHVFGRSVGGAATNIDVTGWDLTGVTSISGLFCSSAIENIVGINTWTNTDDLTDISQMFYGANITSVNLSGLDTSNVTNFSSMFSGCAKLETINLSNFNTSNATTFNSMFSGCSKLESIDISNFVINCDISGTGGMFSGTTSLQTIILPNSISNAIVDGSNSLSLNGMWLKEGEETPIWGENITTGGTYHISNEAGKAYAGVDAYAILYSDGTLVFQKGDTPDAAHGDVVQTWFLYNGTHTWTNDTYKTQVTSVIFRDELVGYTSAYAMFEGCSNLTSISLENFDVSRISNTGFMFNGCTSLVEITNASDLVNSKNTSTRCMFQSCANLISIEGNVSWSLSNTTNPSYMFYGCESLRGLETINWGMNQATTIKCMFYNCSSLTELDISYWNVFALSGASTESCGWVFYGCSGLTSLDLSNWNVASGNAFFKSMFCNCTSLEEVDISGIDMSVADDISYMFYNCPALNKVVLPSSFNRNNATTTNDFGLTGWWTDGTNEIEGKDIISGGTYTRADVVATAGVDAYYVIYNNNGNYTYVVQKGSTTDPTMGSVVNGPYRIYPTSTLGSSSYGNNLTIVFRDRLEGMTKLNNWSLPVNAAIDVIGLDKIDTSLVTAINLPRQFNSIEGVQNWNLSSLKSLNSFFNSTTNSNNTRYQVNYDLTPLASWDVSNVTSMRSFIFNLEGSLDLTPIANWNTSNVTDMGYFAYRSTVDISTLANWNTSSVTNLDRAFYETVLPSYEFLANWDVSNVTTMSETFRKSSITVLTPLANWNTGNVTTMFRMFSECPNLGNTLPIKDWNVSNVTTFESMFNGSTALYNATLNWDFGSAVGNSTTGGMRYMFAACSNLTTFVNDKEWTANGPYNNMSYMFNNCSKLSDISGVANFDMSNVLYINGIFSYTAITNTDALAEWNTSSVTTMYGAFDNCTSLTDLNGISNWDVSHVDSFNNLFYSNTSLSDLTPLANWETSSLNTLYQTFMYCTSLESLDGIGSWDVSHVTNLNSTFYNCSTLSDISALSNWTTSSLQTTSNSFSRTAITNTDDVTSWDLSNLNNATNMFGYCYDLVDVDLSNWNNTQLAAGSSRARQVLDRDTNVVEITFPENFAINSSDVSTFYGNALNGEWVFEEDQSIISNLANDVISNFTNDKAGTYYKRFNLTLYPMGGTITGSRVFTYSLIESVDELPTPTWENHTFLGWYDLNGNQRTSVGPNEHITKLFARWESSSYTLVLNPNKPNLNPVVINLDYDESYKLSNVFDEIPNEELVAWATRSNGAGTVYEVDSYVRRLTDEPDGTIVLYAQWRSTLNDKMPVNAHLINYYTGEEVSVTQIMLDMTNTNISSQLTAGVEIPNNGIMDFWAFADDLDYVNYDRTGLYYNYDNYNTYEAYEDDHITRIPGQYIRYDYNFITEDRAHYVQNHNWTINDYNTDVYGYFIPGVAVRIWFEPQVIEGLDDFTMYVDGQAYGNGEYIAYAIPNSIRYNTGLYSNYGAYTPQYIFDKPFEFYGSGLTVNGNDLRYVGKTEGWTFNYPFYFNNCYSGVGESIELFHFITDNQDDYSNNYWSGSSIYTNNQGERIKLYVDEWWNCNWETELNLTLGLESAIYYDFNGGNSSTAGTGSASVYSTYYCGSGYNPSIRSAENMGFYMCYRDGYTFDGYWTEPEGGIQVISPTNTSRRGEAPFDLTTLSITEIPASIRSSYESATSAYTLYAHWTDDPTVINTNSIKIIVHDERSDTPVYTTAITENGYLPYPLSNANGLDRFISMIDPSEYDGVHIFAGWYTEPNGQGELVDDNYIMTEDYTLHIYAYWPTVETHIYYDAYSYGDSPSNATIQLGYDDYADYFTNGSPAYFTVDSSTELCKELVPIISTNEGYRFIGWFDADGNPITYGNPIGIDTTYYAHWEKYESTGDISYSYSFTYTDNTTYKEFTNTGNNTYYIPEVRFVFSINSTNVTIPAGTVRIEVPYGLYTQFPRFANVSQGKYFRQDGYHTVTNPDGSTRYAYYITNGVDILGAASCTAASTEVTIDGGLDSTNRHGNRRDRQQEVLYYYPMTITIDTDPDDGIVEVTDGSNIYYKLLGEYPTSRLGVVRMTGTQLTSWSDSWGIRPADWNDYVYVRWTISTPGNNTSNQNISGFMRAIGNSGGEVLDSEGLYVNDEYWDDGSYRGNSTGSCSIYMRYPKSMFDYQAQRGIITQSAEYYRIPWYNYANGTKFDRLDTLSGSLSVSWQESTPWQGNGDDVYFNLGRWVYNSSYNKWSYDTYSADRSLMQQRQYLEDGESVGEMAWFGLWARKKYDSNEYSSLAIQPGDIYYNSGAAEDYYMFNTSTGRVQLTEDDYFISNVSWHIYNGYAEDIVDEMGQATGSNTLTDMLRTEPVEIWVQYRGSNEWVLYDTTTGNTYDKPHWIDDHIDVEYQKGGSYTFYRANNSRYTATNIVGVMVRAAYGDSNYQVLQLEPRISLVPNGGNLYNQIETDFNQEAASTFIMDFREGIDPTTQGSNGATYTSGNWAANLTWDGDCGLLVWNLTSDVSDISLYTGVNRWNQGYTNDRTDQIIVWAQNEAETSTYFRPIDSGVFYVLLPEHSTYGSISMNTYETKYANSTISSTTSSYNYNPSYNITVPSDMYSVQAVDNWEGSERTMLIITFENLNSLEKANKRNRVEVKINVNRSLLDRQMFGYYGEVCSLFVNTSAVHPNYVAYYNTFNNYITDNPNGTIPTYYNNLNTQYLGGDIAYNKGQVHFTEPQSGPPVVYQDGFNEFIANSSRNYGATTTVYPGEEFSYRIVYSQTQNAWLKDPIIYSRLDGIGIWQRANFPTLTGMIEGDIEVQVTPTVYYNLDPNFDLANIDSIDLNDGSWTTTEPVGQIVYGLAIDYSKDSNGNSVTYSHELLVDMTIYEKNTCTIDGEQFTGEAILRSENNQDFGASVSGGVLGVTVELPDLSINITSNPESGTQTEPRNVQYEQDLIYSIAVSNSGARAVHNVVVTADIPDGTTLESLTCGGIPLTDSTKFSNVIINGNSITFTISTLRAGETVTVVENTYVSTTENYKVLTNTGHITSYNDMVLEPELQFNSNTTYHITFTVPDPTGLSIAGLTEMIMASLVICGALFFIKKKRKAIN